MAYPPGDHFAYSSGGVIALGGVIANSSNKSIPEFSEEYLFGPLRITTYEWQQFPAGGHDTGGHIFMLPRDMAKLGQLMLNQGNWNGTQLIDTTWVQESITTTYTRETNPTWAHGYGYLWWLNRITINGQNITSYTASGNGGQIFCVYPDLNMIVVSTGGNYHPRDGSHPFRMMEQYILPAIVK